MRCSSPRKMRVAAARRCAVRTSVPRGCATRGAGGAVANGAAALAVGAATPEAAGITGTGGIGAGAGAGAGAPNSAITPGIAASMPECKPGGVADRCRMLKITTSASTGAESWVTKELSVARSPPDARAASAATTCISSPGSVDGGTSADSALGPRLSRAALLAAGSASSSYAPAS